MNTVTIVVFIFLLGFFLVEKITLQKRINAGFFDYDFFMTLFM